MRLDQEAITVVTRWRFRPGTKEGQPVHVRVRLILEFNIR
jgi:outer membrane biosynthesis protein TonB